MDHLNTKLRVGAFNNTFTTFTFTLDSFLLYAGFGTLVCDLNTFSVSGFV